MPREKEARGRRKQEKKVQIKRACFTPSKVLFLDRPEKASWSLKRGKQRREENSAKIVSQKDRAKTSTEKGGRYSKEEKTRRGLGERGMRHSWARRGRCGSLCGRKAAEGHCSRKN